jgi:hypothetical protein
MDFSVVSAASPVFLSWSREKNLCSAVEAVARFSPPAFDDVRWMTGDRQTNLT